MTAETPASGSMPQMESPSLVGEVLGGRYRLLKKLGEGGMGEVYAGEHIHIDKRFAIKLLRPEIVSNKEAVKRFYQEARSSSSIGHRNIIAIEDFGELPDGRLYMCMELLEGAALNDIILQAQPVDRLLNILIQTGHGLAAAHAKNIVHRDMKPENIYVTVGPSREDVPKILDFGIAKVSGNEGQNNLTRTGTIFGTPFYMAPEQALGNPVDARTDIYAMGVIMYEVFSGSLPFQGESFMGILTQHITSEPEPVAQRAAKANRPLPPGLADIIMRCLQKNPAHRYGSMDELVNAMIAIYRGVAGAGMSTYMEAFPVSSAHPVATPGPMTGPVQAAVSSPTMGVGGPPPGMMGGQAGSMASGGHAQPQPSGGHHNPYTPAGGMPPVASQSGLYSPSASSSYVAPKKSSAGLIIAIIAVLAVGGGIAAVVLMSKDEAKAGDGSGSQIASTDPGSGSTTNAGGSGSSGVTTGDGSGSSVITDTGSNAAAPDAGAADGSGSNAVATAGTDAGSSVEPDAGSATVTPVDAGVAEVKMVNVQIASKNLTSFEVWENGTKLFEGPDALEVPEGGERKVVLKAKGYKDLPVTVKASDKKPKFSLTRIPATNTNTTTPTGPKCTNTKADLSNKTCRPIYCKTHPDDPVCAME
ncbi:MAG: serine/threonine protein kinase [Myxococcales bacterium]|nr:serine/threonine protein kinase [Myxococcales bacterium]